MVSCYDCGPRAEPTLSMSVSFGPSDSLLRISALGIESDSAFQRFIDIGTQRGGGLVPLSLQQDSTTYLFYFENKVDTLTLFYRRVFETRRSCGYYLDILEPKGPRYRSTFTTTNVNYSPYTGEFKGLHSTAYGISVSLTKRP